MMSWGMNILLTGAGVGLFLCGLGVFSWLANKSKSKKESRKAMG